MPNKFIIILLFTFLNISTLQAQSYDYDITFDRGIQSPTAASLGKFGDVPVSLYSGKVSLNIPLYTVNIRDLELPISLSYNNSGLKVSEIPSWVGHGWTLNAQGVVTRTVRGLPDESAYGYTETGYRVEESFDKFLYQDIQNETVDPEADIFFYNFAGRSGRFMFDSTGTLHAFGNSPLKIEAIMDGSTISSWKISTEDGIVYTFSEEENITTTTSVSSANNQGSGSSINASSYDSGWYLTKVESPFTGSEITLNYTSSSFFNRNRLGSEEKYTGIITGYNRVSTEENGTVPVLDEIVTDKETITFSSSSRSDFASEKKLDYIEVEINSTAVKKFTFNKGYFSALSSNGNTRLKLNSIDISGISGTDAAGWEFEYYTGDMPSIMNHAFDYWGFYNDETGNNSSATIAAEVPSRSLSGDDRTPSASAAKRGMLKKVTYPTGGYTQMDYEGHDYGSSNTTVGGLRVTELITHDGVDSDNNITKEYEYRKRSAPSQSSGVLVSKPTPFYVYEFNGLSSDSIEVQSSTSVVPLGSVSGSHIGYSEVTELTYHGSSTSETVHKFYTNSLGVSSPQPLVTDDSDKPYGRQTEQRIYNSENDLLSKVVHSFTDNYEYTIWSRKARLLGIDPSTDEPLIAIGKYKDRDIWDYNSQTITKIYEAGSPSNYQTSSTNYYYSDSNHKQLTKKIETNSNGDAKTLELEYAHTIDEGTKDYTGMESENMLSQIYSLALKVGSTLKAKKWFLWEESSSTNYHWMAYKKLVWNGASAVEQQEIIGVDSYNNPKHIKDSMGNITKYYYGNNSNPFLSYALNGVYGEYLTGIQKVKGSVNTPSSGDDLYTEVEYNSQGQISKIINENDDEQRFEYDNQGRLYQVYNANNELITTYDYYFSREDYSSWNPSDPNRVETWSHYDPNNSSNVTKSITFFDGLGREIQTQTRGSATVIASQTEYDERGLPEYVSRPAEVSGSGYITDMLEGVSANGYITNGKSVEDYYDDLVGESEAKYAFTTTSYELSPLARDTSSRLSGEADRITTKTYKLNSSGAFTINGKAWGTNTLKKTIATDPAGNQTITYQDGWGQTIVSGVDWNKNEELARGTSDLVTEFEYDAMGNLVWVKDPQGLVTSYEYNELGQLKEKSLPDQSGMHEYKYDKKGRQRFHQDPNLQSSGHYFYTKYDELDRPTEEGKYNSSAYFNDSAKINDMTFPVSANTWYIKYSYDGDNAHPTESSFNLKGKVTKIQYKDLNTGAIGNTWYSYNKLGLVDWIIQDVPGLSQEYKIEYEYDELERKAEIHFNSGSGDEFYFWYEYDDLGRLQYVRSHNENIKGSSQQEAEYTYYADGQIEKVELGDGVQTLDYDYTIQGWVDKINNGDISGTDKFGIDLGYHLNGNISSQKWRQAGATNSNELTYNYGYDYANRLKSASFTGSGFPGGAFNTDYNYTKNGNMYGIDRQNQNSSYTPKQGDLYLEYISGTNRLDEIEDVDNTAFYSFSYDANGNITSHDIQDFYGATYDWRNLPSVMQADGETIRYVYDGDSNRVKKEVVGESVIYYIRGAEGEVLAAHDGLKLLYWNLPEGIGRIDNF